MKNLLEDKKQRTLCAVIPMLLIIFEAAQIVAANLLYGYETMFSWNNIASLIILIIVAITAVMKDTFNIKIPIMICLVYYIFSVIIQLLRIKQVAESNSFSVTKYQIAYLTFSIVLIIAGLLFLLGKIEGKRALIVFCFIIFAFFIIYYIVISHWFSNMIDSIVYGNASKGFILLNILSLISEILTTSLFMPFAYCSYAAVKHKS